MLKIPQVSAIEYLNFTFYMLKRLINFSKVYEVTIFLQIRFMLRDSKKATKAGFQGLQSVLLVICAS